MSKSGTYTFVPWLRRGMINQINGTVNGRATIPISIEARTNLVGGGDSTGIIVDKVVQLYGPGDVVGFDISNIIKVEPKNGITNFEPNYVPHIEFKDEDLPWRYTPTPNPQNGNLQPWLALIVLTEDEFSEDRKSKPLPSIVLSANAQLQAANQLWGWAHVHMNGNLLDEDIYKQSESTAEVNSKIEELIDENPDLAYSRIVCPRNLEVNQKYHAFLVPSYESGRLVGLGEDIPAGANDLEPAWGNGPLGDHQLPYYYRWEFRTGEIGDFEYLVRLLEPKPVDSRVGVRDMDVQKPGASLQGIVDAEGSNESRRLHGLLKLGGALQIPRRYFSEDERAIVDKYNNWSTINGGYPHIFQENLAKFINLADSYHEGTAIRVNNNSGILEVNTAEEENKYSIANNPDPVISAPLYGRWHSLTQRLLFERDNTTPTANRRNWVHELNLDPRWRVAAGFGTKVIQENQEKYMGAAWRQIGEVKKANKKIREAQLAELVSSVLYIKHIQKLLQLTPAKFTNLLAPINKRVLYKGYTVHNSMINSPLTLASTSVNLRKFVRPKGKISKRIGGFSNERLNSFIHDINKGSLSAALPMVAPPDMHILEDVRNALEIRNHPKLLVRVLHRVRWVKWVPLLIALVSLVFMILKQETFANFMWYLSAILLASLVLFWYLNRLAIYLNRIDSIFLEERQTSKLVDKLPKVANFRILNPHIQDHTFKRSGKDNEVAKRFKSALKEAYALINETRKLSVEKSINREPLQLASMNRVIFQNIDPKLTIKRSIDNQIRIPGIIADGVKETFTEAMAYPKFDTPMYKPLVGYSSELFLPGISYIGQNSISLLETSQKFIECYMTGLNEAFGSELLFRGYPTDRRGSYFRQFWGVDNYLDTKPRDLNSLIDRYSKILNGRIDIELQEFYDKLRDPNVPKTAVLMNRAYNALIREELKDIKPLHYWSLRSQLGEHDNRESNGTNENELVLVIRGELLKKYPTAVIYAHKAVWQDSAGNPVLNNNQTIDRTKERRLMEIPDDVDRPPNSIVKTPLYEAKVDPDIYFFGFDLTDCEAKGGTGDEDDPVDPLCANSVPWYDAGWFFVIKEREGEPRFGLDNLSGDNPEDHSVEIWSDLAWESLVPAVPDGQYVNINDPNPILLPSVKPDNEKDNQWEEDRQIRWNSNKNAADLAYVLYQAPVLVAIHASEMLREL